MDTQEQLWHDTWEDALQDVLIAIYGKAWWKKAAADMFPTECPTDKGKWLQKALDPERAEKLAICDLLWIIKKGRESGFHMAMSFLADDASYTRPTPIEPDDERAELEKQFISAVKQLDKIQARLEHL